MLFKGNIKYIKRGAKSYSLTVAFMKFTEGERTRDVKTDMIFAPGSDVCTFLSKYISSMTSIGRVIMLTTSLLSEPVKSRPRNCVRYEENSPYLGNFFPL